MIWSFGISLFNCRPRMAFSTANENTSAVNMKRQIAKNVVMSTMSMNLLSWTRAHVPMIKNIQNIAIEILLLSIGLEILRDRVVSSPTRTGRSSFQVQEGQCCNRLRKFPIFHGVTDIFHSSLCLSTISYYAPRNKKDSLSMLYGTYFKNVILMDYCGRLAGYL